MITQTAQSLHPLAQIYLARALDPVIEVAQAVAGDFTARAHLYAQVPDDVAALLRNFRSLSGKHPDWPDASQRAFTSGRIVRRFSQDFAGIRLAAIRFIQGASESGVAVLRRSFMESAALMRASVQPLEGAALSNIAQANSSMLDRAIAVLSSSPVSATFAVAQVPQGGWPHSGMFSPQLAYLCENVSQAVALDKQIAQPTVSVLQRAAHYGAATIAGVLAPEFTGAASDEVEGVMQAAMSWATALGDLLARIDVARAWKEPAYRTSMHNLQKDIVPPHPSGDINLEGTVKTEAPSFRLGGGVFGGGVFGGGGRIGLGFSTETVSHEICCSTGDLHCGSNTNGQCDLSDDCPTLTIA